jgi:ribosomal protein S18 acetylase RimI-like enzyme
VDKPPWNLRPARLADRDFLYALNEATMREYVELVWGWDDQAQASFFDNRFQPDRWQVIQVGGQDIGVFIVEEGDDEIFLAEIQILPDWQGRGIGSAIVRSLMDSAATAGKPVTLRVLHVNERARALYERLGFRPFKQIETHTYLRWEG